MLELPKVNKGVRRALSRLGKVKNVVAGVTLAMGIALAGAPGGEAQATTAQGIQQPAPASSGALLLTPGGQAHTLIADHSSHSSHASHASHYSSR
jgi:hypothetical protein